MVKGLVHAYNIGGLNGGKIKFITNKKDLKYLLLDFAICDNADAVTRIAKYLAGKWVTIRRFMQIATTITLHYGAVRPNYINAGEWLSIQARIYSVNCFKHKRGKLLIRR